MPMPMRMRAPPCVSCLRLNSSRRPSISSPACTASSRWFSRGMGVPNTAMNPSPSNWLTNPPRLWMAPNINEKYPFSISWMAAGSPVSESVVNERMSANMTVASTVLPPSEKPLRINSLATSSVAKVRNQRFCWSRRRFFSRLAFTRARSRIGLSGLTR